MRLLAAALSACLAATVALAQDEAPVPPSGPETARATGALLRGLDKVSGRSMDLPLGVGEAVRYGRLEIRLGECRYPAANPSEDAYAQLTIIDLRQNAQVFAGWMLASSPALSALDDARYDVWVISCQS
ncbi:MAG: DUF2155 domain-containing protein [Paracoccus sp. (in: a-proteobacteria)]|uniref:DUF2155 domain-containing protein n=1 Tax=Paracoccus sp. TaxID=267 RepID=UPI00391B7ADE